ncbi:MAG: hypothetical protein AAGK14_11835, partial [Verrucomicrobiota bacterium]
ALVASALYAMVWISVGFHLRAIHPVPKLAERVAALPPQTEMVGMGYSEPSLVFYTDRRWRFDDRPEALELFAQGDGPGVAAIKVGESRLDDLWKHRDPLKQGQYTREEIGRYMDARGLRPLGTLRGINPGRVSYVTVDLFYRPPREGADAAATPKVPEPSP